MRTKPNLAPGDLAAFELFEGLPPAVLAEAAAIARLRTLPKGTLIFNQGDENVRAHGLLAGSLRIIQTGGDGARSVMRFIGPGEMFGAVALFTDGRYPADAIAITDSIEASWSEAELFELIRRHPEIAVNMLRIIGKRLMEAQERVRELSTQPAERRIAHAILRLARQVGHDTREGRAIEFPLRRKDVADISGTTLHTVSRVLTVWEKAGILTSHNRRLTLRLPAEILRIAEDDTP